MKVLLFGFGILISTFCQARPWTDQSEDKIYHFENGNIMINGVRPDENGDYIIDDMVLTKAQIKSYFGLPDGGSFISAGIKSWKYRWPNGEMPYEIHSSISENFTELTNIQNAIKLFNAEMHGCLKMVPYNDSNKKKKWVRITKRTKDGTINNKKCTSMVGRRNRRPWKPQYVHLGQRCHRRGESKSYKIIIHEFIHAWGVYHEQNSINRDDHVEILWKNMAKKAKKHYIINQNSFHFNVPYDGRSIMHYHVGQGAKYGPTMKSLMKSIPTKELGRTWKMTECDKLRLIKMYKCYNWLDDLPCQDEWDAKECRRLKTNGECCDKKVMENCILTCGLCNK